MFLSGIGVSISASFALLISYKIINLLRYIQQARRTGLPYVLTWTLETETVGYILTPILRWTYQDYLLKGEGWPPWCRFMIKDWSFEDKRRAHDEIGDVFLAVSPEGIICYVCDAAMGWDVMSRRAEFTKPRDKYKLLEICGPNVSTTEGKTYRFHVRIVAPPFTDGSGVNDLVWNETKLQTRRLMSSWDNQSSPPVQADINGLTLAIIAKAGFGQGAAWTASSSEGENPIPVGHRINFLEAMTNTTLYIIPVLLLPRWLMYVSPLRKAAIAHKEFEKYVREMIREEKRKMSESTHGSCFGRGYLLNSVLNASADHMVAAAKSDNAPIKTIQPRAFTENEVMGNLFVFLLAGYETTANSILYGLICLALNPGIQDNVIGEVDRVHAQAIEQGRAELTYAEDFDKFKYTYGFMYETLRLFPAVQQITKMVSAPTNVSISTPSGPKPCLLPADCRVYLNVPATHHTERYWPDPGKMDPTRWLRAASSLPPPGSGGKKTPILAAEKHRYTPGTFLSFSDGGRACLGRKFAQAEYVAFLATLLRGYRVKLRDDMDPRMVEKQIFYRCRGTLTLTPLDDVKLVLERREEAGASGV